MMVKLLKQRRLTAVRQYSAESAEFIKMTAYCTL